MPRILQLDHLVLNVRDVDRALHFYHALLGLEVLRLDAFRVGQVAFVSVRVNDQTIIDLFPAPERAAAGGDVHNMDHLCLVADATELEALRRDLERAGYPADGEPRPRWGARGDGLAFYVRDPDGNRVEIRAYPQAD